MRVPVVNFRHIATQKRGVRELPRPWNESPYPKATPPRATARGADVIATQPVASSPATPVSRGQGLERGVSLGGILGGATGFLIAVGGAFVGSLEVAMFGGLIPIIAVVAGGIVGTVSPRSVATMGTGPK